MALTSFQENLSRWQRRFIFVVLALSLFFFFILIRLYYLQVLQGERFRSFADENTLKEIRMPAPRGVIRDRYYRPLASNRPAFDLAVIPQYVDDVHRLEKGLQDLIGIDPTQIKSAWQQVAKLPPFYPLVIAEDVGYDSMARVQVYRAINYEPTDPYDLRGVEILPHPLRRYPTGSVATIALGYVREASRRDLKRLQGQVPGRYFLGDRIGSVGLERRWEHLLKGQDGYQQRVVNAVGREVVTEDLDPHLMRQNAQAGNDLVTTLDADLQKRAEELFAGKSGGLVAMNPQTGEIYAMVSRPTFDLTSLVSHISHDYWRSLAIDPGKVFLNRAINAAYPPGSTYKIVIAAAALEEKVTTPEETVYCPGFFRFGRRPFRCWKSGGHGSVDLHRAIVQSCDVYFYTMGVRLGVDRIARYARQFGFGKRTGIELFPESTGLIPTKAWKQRVYKKPWYPGETPSISIGQGYDLVSPIQNAVMAAAVANGGYRVRPTLTRHFLDRQKQPFPVPGRLFQKRRTPVGLSADTIARLQKAMAGVVQEPGGTARRLSALPFTSGGKTGTAQVVGYESGLSGARYRDHAWYVAFAPVKEPEIAIGVVVEHGGHGSSAAAPIAGGVMKRFMELRTEN